MQQMKWKIFDSGVGSAQQNMDIDSQLLEGLAENPEPTIHLYEWEGLCATYGYFAKPAELLDMEGVKQSQLNLGRRPTGGGIIFHVCDFAFSVAVPSCHPHFSLNTLDNYAFINRSVIEAVRAFTSQQLKPNLYKKENDQQRQIYDHFCMAKPTQYDVMIDGYKIGGAAQRRTKAGFLHQGSISLAMPSIDLLKSVLREEDKVVEAMQACSYTLLGKDVENGELEEARQKIRQHLIESITAEAYYIEVNSKIGF